MTGVRNGVLVRALVQQTGWQQVATVTPTFTWLVKTIGLYNAGAASAKVAVQLQTPSGLIVCRVVTADLGATAEHTWEGWVSAQPGDQLWLFTDAGPVHLWVSGAELPGEISARPAGPPRITPHGATREGGREA